MVSERAHALDPVRRLVLLLDGRAMPLLNLLRIHRTKNAAGWKSCAPARRDPGLGRLKPRGGWAPRTWPAAQSLATDMIY